MVARSILLLACLGLVLAAMPVDANHTGAPYLDRRCDVDVQLVIDTSGSMGGTDGGSQTRMDAAKQGADWFVAQMRTPEDYSGLTQFNSVSSLDKSVDSNHGPKSVPGSTAFYIDQLASGGGTTMGPAIQLAHNDLINNGRTNTSMQYMIILGDGPPSDQSTALANAAAAKANGILIHTIQIGSTISPAFMQGMASSPASKYYHYAAGAQQVVAAFQDIMLEIVDCTPIVDFFAFTGQCSGFASALSLAGNATGTVDVHQFVVNWGDGFTDRIAYPNAGALLNLTHAYANPGWNTINVTLEDTGNRAGYFEQDVYIEGCPVADFECYTSKNPYLRVQFQDLTVDPDNDLVVRAWSFGDGSSTNANTTSVNHDYSALGWYTVTLAVEDSFGNADSIQKPCYADLNLPPVIDPMGHHILYVGNLFTFQVTGYDPDNDPIEFNWVPNQPENARYDTDTQVFSWQPVEGQEGFHGPTQFGVCDFEFCATMNGTFEVRPAPPEQTDPNADADGDGIPDQHDSHPYDPTNGGALEDSDGDGKADSHDNCPRDPNPGQQDIDGDGIGDACDAVADGPSSTSDNERFDGPSDTDGDGITDASDNCLRTPNALQADLDGDGYGDACDGDVDGDRVPEFDADGDPLDNCPRTPNALQEDLDGDGLGDACDEEPAVENPVKVDPDTGHLVVDDAPENRVGGSAEQGATAEASISTAAVLAALGVLALGAVVLVLRRK